MRESLSFNELSAFHREEARLDTLLIDEMSVQAHITAVSYHARVRRVIRNRGPEPLEVTSVFPLPGRAAVQGFRLEVDGRVVEGQLQERSQAREAYGDALLAGHRAGITEEERPEVFSLRVGNLPPGAEATVEIALVGELECKGGEATFRFPLVVAPRYVPGVPLEGRSVGRGVEVDTTQVPDASRVTPPRLLPGSPNPVRFFAEVTFDPAGLCEPPGGWAVALRCDSHSAVVEEGPPCAIRLLPGQRLDRDLLLRFPVAREDVQTVLQCTPLTDDNPGVFQLTLVPSHLPEAERLAPRDVVCVIDRSGSMAGEKLRAACRVVIDVIESLSDRDHFAVVAFDTGMQRFGGPDDGLVAATEGERHRAVEWLGTIEAGSGTEIGPALAKALALFADDTDRDRVLVLVTDGQIAGEDVVLNTLTRALGVRQPRVLVVGIDRAVNAGFLQRVADLFRGGCELVESEGRLGEAMGRIRRRLLRPLLTGLRLERLGGKCLADTVVPSQLPGLYPDEPVTVRGRYVGDPRTLRFRVCGRDAAGREWRQEVTGQVSDNPALLNLWGRALVRQMEDRYFTSCPALKRPRLARQIVAVALEAGVLSRFTAWVAADRSQTFNVGGQVHQVLQLVEMPLGWVGSTSVAEAPVARMPSGASTPGACRRTSARALAAGVARMSSGASTPGAQVRFALAVPELLWELGHGGMGVVYQAFETSHNSPFAVKMLRRDGVSAEDRARFRGEVEALPDAADDLMQLVQFGLFEGTAAPARRFPVQLDVLDRVEISLKRLKESASRSTCRKRLRDLLHNLEQLRQTVRAPRQAETLAALIRRGTALLAHQPAAGEPFSGSAFTRFLEQVRSALDSLKAERGPDCDKASLRREFDEFLTNLRATLTAQREESRSAHEQRTFGPPETHRDRRRGALRALQPVGTV